jgi:ribonuclease P protein component
MASLPSSKATKGTRAFGRDARLRQHRHFAIMRAEGRRYVAATCVLVVLKTPPDGMRRAAFLISRRYSPLAVARNRARRLFREAYRQLYGQVLPCWLLFIPRQRMRKAGLTKLLQDLNEQVRKAGLLEPVPVSPDHDSHPSTTVEP